MLLYIPFLIIDIVVSSTLMSMGMIMLPPEPAHPGGDKKEQGQFRPVKHGLSSAQLAMREKISRV